MFANFNSFNIPTTSLGCVKLIKSSPDLALHTEAREVQKLGIALNSFGDWVVAVYWAAYPSYSEIA